MPSHAMPDQGLGVRLPISLLRAKETAIIQLRRAKNVLHDDGGDLRTNVAGWLEKSERGHRG